MRPTGPRHRARARGSQHGTPEVPTPPIRSRELGQPARCPGARSGDFNPRAPLPCPLRAGNRRKQRRKLQRGREKPRSRMRTRANLSPHQHPAPHIAKPHRSRHFAPRAGTLPCRATRGEHSPAVAPRPPRRGVRCRRARGALLNRSAGRCHKQAGTRQTYRFPGAYRAAPGAQLPGYFNM